VFRAGYSDFRFDEVARSYVTQGGDFVQLVRDRFAGTGGIGGEYTYISESGRGMITFGAEYRSSNLFGSGGFKGRFSPDTIQVPWAQATEITISDATAFFRSTMGFGLNVLPGSRLFMYLNPNLDIQWGQRVFLEDAYKAFVDKGYNDPGDFKVENGLLFGFAGRVNTGVWLSDDVALVLSPGYVYSHSFRESYTGIQYDGVTDQGSSWGYEFSFGLGFRTR
jgi:hypothetical protein